MKIGKLFLLLSLLALFVHAEAGAREKGNGDEYEVFLLLGQSNMTGRGTMLPEDQYDN